VDLTLVRHATLLIELAGRRLLLDPMLDPAGARPPVPRTPNQRPNPLVDLPLPAEQVVEDVDAVLVTHLHVDHLDETALRLLPRDVPVLCQPPDADTLRERGLADVRAVEEALDLDGVSIARTGGRHGTGEIGDAMGPVSGFVLAAPDEPTLYVAGDTIWASEVAEALAHHRPEVVVVNAGPARFLVGDPITMSPEDVIETARAAWWASVVVVHMEAVNHCLVTRDELRERLAEAGLGHVLLPADGERMTFAPRYGPEA